VRQNLDPVWDEVIILDLDEKCNPLECSLEVKVFDKDGNGTIDGKEFDELVYRSLLLFCQARNPDLPAPSKENMQPFIKKLTKQLQPFVDKDQDMQIDKKEFIGYGTYLTTEFSKLQSELDTAHKEKQ